MRPINDVADKMLYWECLWSACQSSWYPSSGTHRSGSRPSNPQL